MTPFGWLDGTLGDLDALRVSVAHRGFVYGDGVFTTFRISEGVLPRSWPLHRERLACDAKALGLDVAPVLRAISLASTACAARLALLGEDAVVRVLVARDGPLGATHRSQEACVVALATPVGARAPASVSARLFERPLRSPLKSLSYLFSLEALAKARAAGDDAALWMQADGALCEGATANVFLAKNGVLFTPPLSLGIVPGTTRAIVLAVAESLGIPCRTTMLFPSDAYAADEAFFTSSVSGIVPIHAFDGHVSPHSVPGPLTIRLASACSEWLDAKLEVEVPSVFR